MLKLVDFQHDAIATSIMNVHKSACHQLKPTNVLTVSLIVVKAFAYLKIKFHVSAVSIRMIRYRLIVIQIHYNVQQILAFNCIHLDNSVIFIIFVMAHKQHQQHSDVSIVKQKKKASTIHLLNVVIHDKISIVKMLCSISLTFNPIDH